MIYFVPKLQITVWDKLFLLYLHLVYDLAVEEVDYSVGVLGVVAGVGCHYYCGAFLVEFISR